MTTSRRPRSPQEVALIQAQLQYLADNPRLIQGMNGRRELDGVTEDVAKEAFRLAALLDGARGQSRATGVVVTWEAITTANGAKEMRWSGLGARQALPKNWLDSRVIVTSSQPITLGPDPVIASQNVRLQLDAATRVVKTDGVGAFEVVSE